MFSQVMVSGGSQWWTLIMWEHFVTTEEVCEIIWEQQLGFLQAERAQFISCQCPRYLLWFLFHLASCAFVFSETGVQLDGKQQTSKLKQHETARMLKYEFLPHLCGNITFFLLCALYKDSKHFITLRAFHWFCTLVKLWDASWMSFLFPTFFLLVETWHLHYPQCKSMPTARDADVGVLYKQELKAWT